MKIGNYYLSPAKLYTGILAIATAMLAPNAPFVPVQIRPFVEVAAKIILLFQLPPAEKWNPEKVQSVAEQAIAYAQTIIPAQYDSVIKKIEQLALSIEASYKDITSSTIAYKAEPRKYFEPSTVAVVSPSPVAPPVVPVTLGDVAAAASSTGATIIAPPIPAVVNSPAPTAAAPAAQVAAPVSASPAPGAPAPW